MVDLGTLGGATLMAARAKAARLSAGATPGRGARVLVDGGRRDGRPRHARQRRQRSPTAVNGSGQVVGQTDHRGWVLHAFSWTQAGGMVDLGTLGGSYAWAMFLTETLGRSLAPATCPAMTPPSPTPSLGRTQAAWSTSGTLGGSSSGPSAVNDAGQVVGGSTTAGDAGYHGTPGRPRVGWSISPSASDARPPPPARRSTRARNDWLEHDSWGSRLPWVLWHADGGGQIVELVRSAVTFHRPGR